jgi:cytoskeletal protein CcmA (bactofilin family)
MKKKLSSLLVILFVVAMTFPGRRAEGQGRLVVVTGESLEEDQFFAGEEVRIDGELVGDLVFAGRSANVDGTVSGDLITAIQDLQVSGNVHGDIWGAGQTIRIEGEAKGDVRSAGQRLEIDGRVGNNVLWLGQELSLSRGAEIGRNLRIGVQRASLSGNLGGSLRGGAEELVLAGEVLGDVDVVVGRLIIEEEAVVHGAVRYESTTEAAVAERAQLLGGIERVEPESPDAARALAVMEGLRTFLRVVSWILFLGFLLVGVLGVRLFPGVWHDASHTLQGRPWASLGLGFALLVAVPVAGMICLITLIGFPLGFLVLIVYATTLYLSSIPVAIFVGGRIFERLQRRLSLVWSFLAGAVILQVLSDDPRVRYTRSDWSS